MFAVNSSFLTSSVLLAGSVRHRVIDFLCPFTLFLLNVIADCRTSADPINFIVYGL